MKKIFAVILCVIVLASFTLRSAPAHAIGPGLMIAGSTVINGSIAALIASIVAQPMGLVDQINAAAEAAGVRAVDHLEELLRDYSTSAQIPITSIYTLLNSGVMYAANGAITLSEEASDFFGDFFSWAHSEEGGNLQQYDTVSSTGEMNLDYSKVDTQDVGNFTYNGNLYLSTSAVLTFTIGSPSYYNFNATGSSPVFFITGTSNANGNGTQYVYAFSESPFTVSGNYPGSSISTTAHGITYYYYVNTNLGGNHAYYSYSPQVSFAGSFGLTPWQAAYLIFNGKIIGESDVDTTVYEFESGSGYDTNIVYAGDVVAIPDFGDPNQQGTADIAGWLGGVSDVIYTGGGTISVTDDQGVTTDYGMTKSGVDEMQITKTAADTVDQVIGGTVAGVGSGTIQGELADYTLDLRDFFPFCIPFDIYRMLSLFAASREAPHVEWRFLVPGIVDQTIDIDLSVFDNVAATLRSVELVAAAIGLALMTKRLIQGGD